MRRFLHSVLHDKIAATYEPIQERESKALLLGLLSQPDDFQDLFMLFSSNIILQVLFLIHTWELLLTGSPDHFQSTRRDRA